MRPIALALLAAFASSTALGAMQAEPVEWKIDDTEFQGYLVYDDAGAKRPGLVMFPNWMGVNASAVEKAKAVAGDDYVVLVADVYGKGVRPKDGAEAGKLAGSLRSADRAPLRTRIAASVATLKTQADKTPLEPTKIGAFGFCFGGSTVLELARSGAELAGVVSLHGGLAPGAESTTAAISSPVLVLNGAADRSVSDADIAAFEREMDTAGADWQFVDFSGAVHCFAEADSGTDPTTNCAYDERAAKRAYRMMADFFAERFGG